MPLFSRVPTVSRRQMVEVDRLMIEEYGIGLAQMMENAGRGVARAAREVFLDGDASGSSVIVFAGTGGNGGGALAAARRLAAWGSDVSVVTSALLERYQGVPADQLKTLRRMGIEVSSIGSGLAGDPPDNDAADLVIDGLVGYNLRGAPEGGVLTAIETIDRMGVPVLALDVPSGLDADTGRARGRVVRASATVTLALPKKGLTVEEARPFVGDLYLADISVPPDLYRSPGLGLVVADIFARDDLVRLEPDPTV